jgi:hypothetical protein
MNRYGVFNRFLALLIGVGVQQIEASAREPGQAAAPAAKAGTPKDLGWPRVYTDGKATIAVHQPQVDDWKDFALLDAWSAIEIQPDKSSKKVLAAVHWKSESDTDIAQRTVVLKRPEIVSFRIPGETEEKTKELEALTLRLLPAKTDAVALDRVLAYLDVSRAPARERCTWTKRSTISVPSDRTLT